MTTKSIIEGKQKERTTKTLYRGSTTIGAAHGFSTVGVDGSSTGMAAGIGKPSSRP
jgi:hypothetical protein